MIRWFRALSNDRRKHSSHWRHPAVIVTIISVYLASFCQDILGYYLTSWMKASHIFKFKLKTQIIQRLKLCLRIFQFKVENTRNFVKIGQQPRFSVWSISTNYFQLIVKKLSFRQTTGIRPKIKMTDLDFSRHTLQNENDFIVHFRV